MNEKLIKQVKNFFASILGINENELQNNSSILQLGIDSVMMITVVSEFNEKFGTDLSLSDITFKHNTIELLSDFLGNSKIDSIKKTPEIAFSSEKSVDDVTDFDFTEPDNSDFMKNEIDSVDVDLFLKVCQQQNEVLNIIFSKQLDVLSIHNTIRNNKNKLSETSFEKTMVPKKAKREDNSDKIVKTKAAFTPGKVILTEQQSKMLNELITKLSEKTKKSKELSDIYRQYLADLDESAGFSMLLKEIHYQISSQSCHGSKMIDVDGNEYIDIAMGFGTVILGHSPEFVVDAIKKEVDLGVQLAPRHRLVGEVAKLVCELTGFDRACFTVTGTEAIMTVMKIARAYMNREKIGIFNGCYHGHNDPTLISRMKKDGDIQLLAPGISKSSVNGMVLFDYDDENAIQEIINRKDELAAVIIEPVQSRRPEIQPVEFLKKLRKVTEENNILLVFDEVITGFRCHIGGAKKLFGIDPDLAVYGKAAGNGMPIGIVAGKSEVMDVVDGGLWNFGDDSYPEKDHIFTAGTFFKHPLSMAAVHSILNYYKKTNNSVQEKLTEKTIYLVSRLNEVFKEYNAPFEVNNFSSLFIFKETDNNDFLNIFFYKLLYYGVFTWEGRTCFLSEAHTDSDIEGIIDAVKKSVLDMYNAGFFHMKEDDFKNGIPDTVFYE